MDLVVVGGDCADCAGRYPPSWGGESITGAEVDDFSGTRYSSPRHQMGDLDAVSLVGSGSQKY